MYRSVTSKTTFEGVHCWPEAPDEVAFLRNPHRHIFHVEAHVVVQHNDRDVEFVMLKHKLDKRLSVELDDNGVWQMGRKSCEDVAEMLMVSLISWYPNRAVAVSVFEDGENGCTITSDPQGKMQ